MSTSQRETTPMTNSGSTAVLHEEETEQIRKWKSAALALSRIQLSIVVTVYTETFSIRETVDTLIARFAKKDAAAE